MPRQKTQSDQLVLETAHRLIHAEGPEALTFARLALACGLAPATLVQRFKTKAGLKQATLLHAWNKLDAKTARLAAEVPKTPEGAIRLLTALSGDYGGIETYAEGLARTARGSARSGATGARRRLAFSAVAGA